MLTRLRGFSVLDLQLAIGLALILMAILLPAVTAARQSAQAVACAASMRQIGLLLQVYSSGNADWTPRDEAHPLTGVGVSWVRVVRLLLGEVDDPAIEHPYALGPSRAMQCPSHPLRDIPTSYVSNAMFFEEDGSSGTASVLMTRRSRIRHPSGVPYLLEAANRYPQPLLRDDRLNGIYFAAFHDVWRSDQFHGGTGQRMTLTRHGQAGSNAMMFDGSVRAIRPDDWHPSLLDDGVRDRRWTMTFARDTVRVGVGR